MNKRSEPKCGLSGDVGCCNLVACHSVVEQPTSGGPALYWIPNLFNSYQPAMKQNKKSFKGFRS